MSITIETILIPEPDLTGVDPYVKAATVDQEEAYINRPDHLDQETFDERYLAEMKYLFQTKGSAYTEKMSFVIDEFIETIRTKKSLEVWNEAFEITIERLNAQKHPNAEGGPDLYDQEVLDIYADACTSVKNILR